MLRIILALFLVGSTLACDANCCPPVDELDTGADTSDTDEDVATDADADTTTDVPDVQNGN